MTDSTDLDEQMPDAYTDVPECHARKKAATVIGAPTHTHICREFVDDEAQHLCPHQCTCGFSW